MKLSLENPAPDAAIPFHRPWLTAGDARPQRRKITSNPLVRRTLSTPGPVRESISIKVGMGCNNRHRACVQALRSMHSMSRCSTVAYAIMNNRLSIIKSLATGELRPMHTVDPSDIPMMLDGRENKLKGESNRHEKLRTRNRSTSHHPLLSKLRGSHLFSRGDNMVHTIATAVKPLAPRGTRRPGRDMLYKQAFTAVGFTPTRPRLQALHEPGEEQNWSRMLLIAVRHPIPPCDHYRINAKATALPYPRVRSAQLPGNTHSRKYFLVPILLWRPTLVSCATAGQK